MTAKKHTSDTVKHDFVQLRNPRSGSYVKIDRTLGQVVSSKTTPGPYKGVPIVSAIK